MIRMFARPFYFLRHGETVANANGVISGSLDVPLTALGCRQAEAAARALAHEPITAIYSSPLRRARETAEPVAQALGLSVTLIPELVERKRGELEGKAQGIQVKEPRQEGSEPFEDFVMRVLKGLSQINTDVPLVIAHLGVFRALCQTLDINGMEKPVQNALPVRFVPAQDDAWKVQVLPIALDEVRHR
jgi:broad specificity phosphatase PhoE